MSGTCHTHDTRVYTTHTRHPPDTHTTSHTVHTVLLSTHECTDRTVHSPQHSHHPTSTLLSQTRPTPHTHSAPRHHTSHFQERPSTARQSPSPYPHKQERRLCAGLGACLARGRARSLPDPLIRRWASQWAPAASAGSVGAEYDAAASASSFNPRLSSDSTSASTEKASLRLSSSTDKPW